VSGTKYWHGKNEDGDSLAGAKDRPVKRNLVFAWGSMSQ
jgi:hypothetical protein